MKRYVLLFALTLTILTVLIPSLAVAQSDGRVACRELDIQTGPLAKVGGDLAALYCGNGGELNQGSDALVAISRSRDGTRLVTVDVVVREGGDSAELLTKLQSLGLVNGSVYGAVVSGRLPIDSIGALSQSEAVRFARPAVPVKNVVGSAENEAVIAMQADDISNTLNVTGTGVTIGVISDSYGCENNTNTTVAQDIASGDLPTTINLLEESDNCPNTIDEGRAMVQLIHDIAPGSDIAFHAAFNGGQAGLANAILALANDTQGNADIVVDDVAFRDEPFYQDGVVAQAVDQVVANGVAYFSSAGNSADQAYASPFNDGATFNLDGALVTAHDFGGGDVFQLFTMPANSLAVISFQWANPYASATGSGGATTDLDVLVFPAGTSNATFGNVDNNLGGDPASLFVIDNRGQPARLFEMLILRRGGTAPPAMKYIFNSLQGPLPTFQEHVTNSPTVFGHANAAGAIAVGAAFFEQTPEFGVNPAIPEPFTSLGGDPILFGGNDQPINVVREQPKFLAPDGVSNTFFGQPAGVNQQGPFLFFGTSAAAPNLAALAALLQSATDETLSPTEIVDLLQEATPQEARAAYDPLVGFGIVQGAAIIDDLQNSVPTSIRLTQIDADGGVATVALPLVMLICGSCLLVWWRRSRA